MKSIKVFDIFGVSIGYEDNDSDKYKSTQGVIFTMIIGIIITVIGFLFGKNLYLRINPNIIYSKELKSSSIIDFKKSGLFLTFVDPVGTPLKYADLVDVYGIIYSLDSYSKVNYYNKTSLIPCDEINFPFGKDDYKNAGCTNETCVCLNPDINYNITNTYVSPNSTFLHLAIYPCNPSLRKCSDNMNTTLKNFLLLEIYSFLYYM